MNTSAPTTVPCASAPRVPAPALALGASTLAWAVLLAAFSPVEQNFPLNDDWAFARGAFRFARGGGIDYGGWASMPQLGQWLWACPFLWVLGESFFALRVSTIALSWLGLWAFHDLLRQAGVPAGRAALATACLAFNPLFFLLQGTFMTDVPALSLALAALALYVRAMQGKRFAWLAAACLVACLAAITRQNTVAVVAVAAVLLWRRPELRRRPAWWLAVAAPAATGVLVHLWFQARPDVRPLAPGLPAPPGLLSLPFLAVHFCGLSALPLLVQGPWARPWKAFGTALAVLLACAGYWLLYGAYLPYGGLFPYAENMLSPFGAFAGSRFTGPFVAGDRPVLLGTPSRVVLTVLGCLAGAVLVARTLGRRRAEWAEPLPLFALLAVPFLLIVNDFYDRYLLFLLPGGLALALPGRDGEEGAGADNRGWPAAAVLVAVMAGASVGLMHDWLAWNAARWELGRRAVRKLPTDAGNLEGGVEWDGWHAGVGPVTAPSPADGPRWPVLPFTREWFPAIRGRYVLSFSEVKGARVVDVEPYSLWLAPGRRQFFLLEVPPLRPRPAGDSRGQAP